MIFHGDIGWRAGRDRRREQAGAGFTLLEILMVLALIGLLVGALVTAGAQLMTDRGQTPEEIFWKAVNQSRQAALTSGHEVQMRYSAKEKDVGPSLILTTTEGEQRVPFPPAEGLEVSFLSGQQGSSSVLIGGQLVETQTIAFVIFYPDGTCSPFKLQIRQGGGAGRIVAIDPWTCAPVLTTETPAS